MMLFCTDVNFVLGFVFVFIAVCSLNPYLCVPKVGAVETHLGGMRSVVDVLEREEARMEQKMIHSGVRGFAKCIVADSWAQGKSFAVQGEKGCLCFLSLSLERTLVLSRSCGGIVTHC